MAAADQLLGRAIDFDRSCWHTVDPGTVLLTDSVNREVSCSGSWLAEFEYVVEDVNKRSFLARSGRLSGSTSQATHGRLTRSARHRSHHEFGIGDELRGSMVDHDGYWAAVGLLRDDGRAWFTEEDVALLARLSTVIAAAARRALVSSIAAETMAGSVGPGVATFDADGKVESLTPAAEQWIGLMTENPPPDTPGDSKVLQAVAARARNATDGDPLETAARARLRAADGTWLLLYGSRLSGGEGRTVVVIQQASPSEVAPPASAPRRSPRGCTCRRTRSRTTSRRSSRRRVCGRVERCSDRYFSSITFPAGSHWSTHPKAGTATSRGPDCAPSRPSLVPLKPDWPGTSDMEVPGQWSARRCAWGVSLRPSAAGPSGGSARAGWSSR